MNASSNENSANGPSLTNLEAQRPLNKIEILSLYAAIPLYFVSQTADSLSMYSYYSTGDYWFFGIYGSVRGVFWIYLILQSLDLGPRDISKPKWIFLLIIGLAIPYALYKIAKLQKKIYSKEDPDSNLFQCCGEFSWIQSYVVGYVGSYLAVYYLFYTRSDSPYIIAQYLWGHVTMTYSLATDIEEYIIWMKSHKLTMVYGGFGIRRFLVYFMDTAVVPLIWAIFASATRPTGAWIIFGSLAGLTAVYFCVQTVVNEVKSNAKFTIQRICWLFFSIPISAVATGILISLGYTKMVFFAENNIADRVYIGIRIGLVFFMVFYLVGTDSWQKEVNMMTPILEYLLIVVYSIGAVGLVVILIITLAKEMQRRKNISEEKKTQIKKEGEMKNLINDPNVNKNENDEIFVQIPLSDETRFQLNLHPIEDAPLSPSATRDEDQSKLNQGRQETSEEAPSEGQRNALKYIERTVSFIKNPSEPDPSVGSQSFAKNFLDMSHSFVKGPLEASHSYFKNE